MRRSIYWCMTWSLNLSVHTQSVYIITSFTVHWALTLNTYHGWLLAADDVHAVNPLSIHEPCSRLRIPPACSKTHVYSVWIVCAAQTSNWHHLFARSTNYMNVWDPGVKCSRQRCAPELRRVQQLWTTRLNDEMRLDRRGVSIGAGSHISALCVVLIRATAFSLLRRSAAPQNERIARFNSR